MHAGFRQCGWPGLPGLVLWLCLLCLPLCARASIDGSYTAAGAKGASALLLKVQGGRVSGSLRHAGVSYILSGKLEEGGVVGELRGSGKRLYIEAQPMPQGQGLLVLIAAIGADGQPDDSTEQMLEFQRAGAGGGTGQGAPPAAPQAMAPPGPARPDTPMASDASLASTPQDRQVAQFLAASPWCHYSYKGGNLGGTEKRERVVFSPDGRVASRDGSESSYSGQVGGQAWGTNAQGGGGQQGRWRVRQAQLEMSADGQNWLPVPLQLSQNSNGHPILTTNGKEYFRCN